MWRGSRVVAVMAQPPVWARLRISAVTSLIVSRMRSIARVDLGAGVLLGVLARLVEVLERELEVVERALLGFLAGASWPVALLAGAFFVAVAIASLLGGVRLQSPSRPPPQHPQQSRGVATVLVPDPERGRGAASVEGMSTSHAMSRADAAWLHMDRPTNLMVINSVLWFDEPVDWERCEDVFRERLVERFDRFRQRPVEGLTGPHWEDAELDLDLHFHHVRCPRPGTGRRCRPSSPTRLADAAGSLAPALGGLPRSTVYGVGAAVLMRMHHCIADGIALARVMLTLTDGGPAGGPGFAGPVRAAASTLGTLTGTAGALAHEAIDVVRHPRHALGTAVEDAQTLAKLLLPGSDPQHRDQGRPARRPPRRLVGAARPLARQARRARARRHGQRRAGQRGHGGARRPPAAPRATCPTRCTRWSRSTCGRSTSRSRASWATASASSSSACPSASPIRCCERSRSSAGWTRSSTGTRARSRTGSSS